VTPLRIVAQKDENGLKTAADERMHRASGPLYGRTVEVLFAERCHNRAPVRLDFWIF